MIAAPQIDPEEEFGRIWMAPGSENPPAPVVPTNSEFRALFARDQERRGLASGTIAKRISNLQTFDRWLDEESYSTVSSDRVASFLDSRRLGHKARYCWISNLHSFYRWGIGRGLIKVNPTVEIDRPKTERAAPRPAPTDQLADALELSSPLVRCWILLAAFEGMKVSEIARLRWDDVIGDDKKLRIRGAGRKGDRFVPLHPTTLVALLGLTEGRPLSGHVFIRPLGGPYGPSLLSQRFNAALRDLGIAATPNELRHWFATNLYTSTRDLSLVQTMLGHASPATTANCVIPAP